MPKKLRFLILALGTLAAASVSAEAGGSLLIKNGTLLTVTRGVLVKADILVVDGLIRKIGPSLDAPPGLPVVDVSGKYVIPGIIDSHTHIALDGTNEGSEAITPEADVGRVVNADDVSILTALSGGVTMVHTMHGSANPIGGRGLVLKLRWGKNASEMIFRGAPPTVKWALGENPKQSNFQGAGPARYPRTRMGVEASIRLELDRAREYMKAWADYEAGLKALKKGEPRPLPPRRDTRLEVVADMLRGKYLVRCHAYQSEEMLSIMKLCREYGLKLAAFEHGLEGYRIADELVSFGVGVTTFADFWAYKWEAYNTLPHAAALMARRGVLTAVNSDDAERMRRLYHEAAKTVRFGGLSEAEALKTITLNPAKMLGVESRVGTLEAGKDADIAVFSRHPFDPYTVCQMTIVDGEIVFDRAVYLEERKKADEAARKKEAEAGSKAKKPGREG